MPTVNGYVNPELGSTDWPGFNNTLAKMQSSLPPADSSLMSIQPDRGSLQTSLIVKDEIHSPSLIAALEMKSPDDFDKVKNKLNITVKDYDGGTNITMTAGLVTMSGGTATITLEPSHNVLSVVATIKGHTEKMVSVNWSSNVVTFYTYLPATGEPGTTEGPGTNEVVSYIIYMGTAHTSYYSRVNGSYSG